MLRFRPAFCFTLRPGLAVVPLADLVMRFTRRSSMATQPWLLVRSVVSLWVKSCRRRACRARSLAISAMVRHSRLEYRPPLWRLAHLTCRALRRSRPSRRRCSPSVRDGAISRGSGSSDTNAEHATPKSTAQPRQAGGTGGTAAYRPWAGGPRPSGATARGPRRPGQGTESTDRLPAFGTSAPWRDAQGSTSCRTRDRADEEPAAPTAQAGRPATAAPHAPASGRGTGQTRGSSHRAAARRTAVAPARCSTPRGSCGPTRQAHSLLGGRIGTVAATSVGDHAGMLLGRWDTIRTFVPDFLRAYIDRQNRPT